MTIFPSLPFHSRVVLFAALAGLLASCVSFLFSSVPAGFLCFYFALCWFLWIISTLLGAGRNYGVLAITWNIINISILIMFLSVTASMGDTRHSQGTELVWFVSYLPMVLPVGLAFNPTFIVTQITPRLEYWFGGVVGGEVSDWLQLSIIAVAQSLIIIFLVRGGCLLLALKRRVSETKRN